MEPADFRHCQHSAPISREDGTRLGTIHCQRSMRPPAVIIGTGAGEDALQMLHVEDHYMIETLPTDTPDGALHRRVLPRTLGCDHDFCDPHVLDALPKGR